MFTWIAEIASVASVHRERANEEPRSIKACDRASLSCSHSRHVVEGISAAGAAFLIFLPTPHAYLPLIIILVDTFPISLVTQTVHSTGKTCIHIIQPTAFSDCAGDGFWSKCSLSISSLRCSRAIFVSGVSGAR